MAPNRPSEDETNQQKEIAERSKERYLKFFMVDFVEMSMRKVAQQNIVFCANQAKVFDRLMDDDEMTRREQKR